MKNINGKFLLLYIFPTVFATALFFANLNFAFASTNITEDIVEDTTWTLEGSPYIVQNDIIVDFDATLTIEPGVVVKFVQNRQQFEVTVFGAVHANGSPDSKIYFTSLLDDSVGGDTNGDGIATKPLRFNIYGDWQGFNIYSPGSYFKNSVIRYAKSGIVVDGSDFSVDGSKFEYNYQAIDVYDGVLDIQNSQISNSIGYYGIYSDNSVITANNIKISDFPTLAFGIGILIEGSDLTLNNSLFEDLNGFEAIAVAYDSSAKIDNTVFNNIGNDVVLGYVNADISISNSDFSNQTSISDSFLYIWDDSKAEIKDTIFSNSLGYGLIVENSSLKIADSEIKDITNMAAIMDYGGGRVSILSSKIYDNKIGLQIYEDSDYFNSTYDTYGNNFYNNIEYQVQNYAAYSVDLKNNFWGDPSGPHHLSLNPEGVGGEVSDNVDFDPWCADEACTPPTSRDPVIIIPGITGSILNKNYDDFGEIWPNVNTLITSISDSFLDDLALGADGKEVPGFPIKVGDIIRKVEVDVVGKNLFSAHVFDNMISDLIAAGYTEGTDLFVFPYDWRFSNSDNAKILKDKIDEVLTATGKDKVDIIAHSMGGLLSKEYIAQNGKEKVDQLIFLGTPHLGSPKAFKTLMWGR